jgi:predicted Zn-dependent protease
VNERDRRLAEAVGLREAGRAQEAQPLLLALAAEYPQDAEVQYQTAWAHDLLGLEAEAVPYYEQALALGIAEPHREGLVLGLGSTYRNVGRHADAVALLSEGVRDYPANAALRCFLALAQLSDGQPQVALATALSVVLDTCPDASVERYRRALSWYRDDLLGIADPEG